MFSQTFDISVSLPQPIEQIYPTFERNFSVYLRSNGTVPGWWCSGDQCNKMSDGMGVKWSGYGLDKSVPFHFSHQI